MAVLQSTGPTDAKIMIVGDFPSEREENEGRPFIGGVGMELDKMLKAAGIYRNQCFITCAVRERPPKSDLEYFIPTKKKNITSVHKLYADRMVAPAVIDGIEHLKREIELVKPNVIIAMGNVALWALTGEWGITTWRGSEMVCKLNLALDIPPRVVPAFSPGLVMRQWPMRRFTIQDYKRVARTQNLRAITPPDYKFIIQPDLETVQVVLKDLLEKAEYGTEPLKLAVDIETKHFDISCLGIGWSRLDAICIPFTTRESRVNYWTAEEEFEVQSLLRQLLQHPNVFVIGQNFAYDIQWTERDFLLQPNLRWDTMLAQHVMFSQMPKSLHFMASIYCQYYVYWKDEREGNETELEDWTYNCKDCVNTWEIQGAQEAAIKAMKLESVNEFQQELFWPVFETMKRGLRVHKAYRADLAMQLMEGILEREAWINKIVGHELSVGSSPQMQNFFYGEMAQKPIYHRKTKGLTTDEEALQKIGAREPLLKPLVDKMGELRSLGVFLSTFIQAPLDIDQRTRCYFNIGGTETYRFSSSKNAFGSGMNLQNIPKGSKREGFDLPNVREMFIPDPGMTFFDIDLSSADLRIVVWEADEGEMKAMLAEGLDPYTEVAKEFYKDPSINKKDPRRQKFKAFCHGTHYLGTAKGLAERLGLSVQQATITQNWYFDRFPRIKQAIDDLKDQVLRRGYVENVFGYRFYVLDRVEGTVMNQIAAWRPQSTVGCIINRAYMNIYKNLPEVQVLLQVHDSLGGQFPTAREEYFKEAILENSRIVLPYSDPLIIPVDIKTSTRSWGDCE